MDPVPLTLVFRQTPDPAVWAIIENVPLSHEGIFWNFLDDGDTACLELQNGIELQGLLCESTTRLCDNSGVSGQFLVNTPVTTLKRSTKLASLQFELVNFPRFLGQQDLHVTDVTERTKNEEERVSYLKLGSFQVWAEPWYIGLTALPDIVEVDRRLERDGGCEVTHIGRIVRSDNSCFDVEEGLEIHSKLVRFLSFARGGSCGSIVLRGRHKNHDLVWELWGSPRVTPLEAIQTNWFDSHHGEQLAEVFPGFLRFWVRNVDCDRNRMSAALDWYCEALATDPPYTRIVLIQIVLERLERILSGKGKSSACGWISKVLQDHNVVPFIGIPTECKLLKKFADTQGIKPDGPCLLAYIRNELIHSGMDFGILSGSLCYEASQLGIWYAELLFLFFFDHKGMYANRITRKWVGQVEPMPNAVVSPNA